MESRSVVLVFISLKYPSQPRSMFSSIRMCHVWNRRTDVCNVWIVIVSVRFVLCLSCDLMNISKTIVFLVHPIVEWFFSCFFSQSRTAAASRLPFRSTSLDPFPLQWFLKEPTLRLCMVCPWEFFEGVTFSTGCSRGSEERKKKKKSELKSFEWDFVQAHICLWSNKQRKGVTDSQGTFSTATWPRSRRNASRAGAGESVCVSVTNCVLREKMVCGRMGVLPCLTAYSHFFAGETRAEPGAIWGWGACRTCQRWFGWAKSWWGRGG